MQKNGIEWHVTTELTDAQVLADPRFRFPCSFSVDLAPNIVKKIQYDRNGVKSSGLYSGEVEPNSYQTGPITTTSNSVTIGLHPSGENYAIINGTKYIEPTPIVAKLVTPVSAGKLKQVIIHALPDASVFHIAEGIEGEQATTPDFTGLFVASIIFSDSGQIIDNGFLKSEIKYTEEDGWRNITLTEALTVLPYTFDLRSSYWIESQIGSPTIGGIRNSLIDRNTSPSWDGKEFWIYNNTGSDLPLNSEAVTEEDVFLFTSQITLKPYQSCKVKIRNFALEVVGVLSSGSSFPELGNNGDVLEKDSTTDEGAKWSNRLTLAETNIISESASRLANDNAEIVERAAQDAILNAKINTEITNRTTGDDYLLSQIVADAVRILALENKKYQLGDQIEVQLPATVLESWNGKVILFTSSGTLIVPGTGLGDSWSFNGGTLIGVTIMLAITTPKTWYFVTPPPVIPEKQIFTIAQRGSTNSIMLFGV
ncbi:hypothetical protein [Chryseobacterium sp. MP_3.2]|uniref:hypothetical protein n=1 Tax=Chryseobacterium sp. MP_3.2 TaxID=3071712 RepID=UPI002E0B03EF|nr:hypothetical protein [Chryseobacterium sp. MP_3.2]